MSLNIPERLLATARNDNQNNSFVISNEVRDLSQIEPLLDNQPAPVRPLDMNSLFVDPLG